MIDRHALTSRVTTALTEFRAVALVGPRQVGKTTLARRFVRADHPNYFDLEDPAALARLDQPMNALAPLRGLIVIDEMQRRPDLFPVLRVLMDRADRIGTPGQFLLLGSASPALLQRSSETLLGRLLSIEVTGLTLEEVGHAAGTVERLWVRGGYPLAFSARDDGIAQRWCSATIDYYITAELPALGINVPAPGMTRFWQMLTHMHGQIWNAADPARSLGLGETTVRRYLDHLTQSFFVRQLQPWHENLAKRQVKSPKVYFRDSGLLHASMGLRGLDSLLAHPRAGASWEGFALEQVLRVAQPDAAYFWSTHAGAELDLMLFKNDQRIGIEFKRADAPKITPSMQIALKDLRLDALYVVYPGIHRYTLAPRVEAVPLAALLG